MIFCNILSLNNFKSNVTKSWKLHVELPNDICNKIPKNRYNQLVISYDISFGMENKFGNE